MCETQTQHGDLRARLWCELRTQEEGGLAHGLETAAAVLVHCPVAGCQDDQHPVVGELLASCHRSFQEAAAPASDFLTMEDFVVIFWQMGRRGLATARTFRVCCYCQTCESSMMVSGSTVDIST